MQTRKFLRNALTNKQQLLLHNLRCIPENELKDDFNKIYQNLDYQFSSTFIDSQERAVACAETQQDLIYKYKQELIFVNYNNLFESIYRHAPVTIYIPEINTNQTEVEDEPESQGSPDRNISSYDNS